LNYLLISLERRSGDKQTQEAGDTMKLPTDQEQRKEDKKEEKLRNPSRVQEPEPDEPEGEIEAA
jgi:hypothetical protein